MIFRDLRNPVNRIQDKLAQIIPYLQDEFNGRPEGAAYSSLRLHHDVDDIRSIL
jgi:hypothetical protein